MTTETPRRILFVDDEPANVAYHVRALQDSGYEVELIDSAAKAEDLCLRSFGDPGRQAETAEYDLLILDMMMPPPKSVQSARVCGGLATGAYIVGRHHQHHPSVPAIILSNLTEQECVDMIFRVCAEQLPRCPENATPADLLVLLREQLNVTICEKRRTPPFMLPTRVGEILDDKA